MNIGNILAGAAILCGVAGIGFLTVGYLINKLIYGNVHPVIVFLICIFTVVPVYMVILIAILAFLDQHFPLT